MLKKPVFNAKLKLHSVLKRDSNTGVSYQISDNIEVEKSLDLVK